MDELSKETLESLLQVAEKAREACTKPTTRRNWSESMYDFQQRFDTATCVSLVKRAQRCEQLEAELIETGFIKPDDDAALRSRGDSVPVDQDVEPSLEDLAIQAAGHLDRAEDNQSHLMAFALRAGVQSARNKAAIRYPDAYEEAQSLVRFLLDYGVSLAVQGKTVQEVKDDLKAHFATALQQARSGDRFASGVNARTRAPYDGGIPNDEAAEIKELIESCMCAEPSHDCEETEPLHLPDLYNGIAGYGRSRVGKALQRVSVLMKAPECGDAQCIATHAHVITALESLSSTVSSGSWPDDPAGLPIGLNDSVGHPIHIGDVLDFDPVEWGGPMQFTIELVNGEIRHPGAASDLVQWCKVTKCVRDTGERNQDAD